MAKCKPLQRAVEGEFLEMPTQEPGICYVKGCGRAGQVELMGGDWICGYCLRQAAIEQPTSKNPLSRHDDLRNFVQFHLPNGGYDPTQPESKAVLLAQLDALIEERGEYETKESRNWHLWQCMDHKRFFVARAGCSKCAAEKTSDETDDPTTCTK